METQWNSDTLKVAYTVFGWVAFVVWSSSFYPQFFLNFSRKRYSIFFFYLINILVFSWNQVFLIERLKIVVWLDWTSTICYWTTPNTPYTSSTTHLCTSALLFSFNITKNMVLIRYLFIYLINKWYGFDHHMLFHVSNR
jgi:hypothetical protein